MPRILLAEDDDAVRDMLREALDRDAELMQCIGTDRRNEKLYRAVLYRDGFIEGNRFFK